MADQIVQRLEAVDQDSLAWPFEIDPMPGDQGVYRLTINDQDEFPIALSESDGELLCLVRLFGLDEVDDAKRLELYETLLAGSLSLPLSTFGLSDGAIYLFGSLSSDSKTEVIVQEIEYLAENTLEALELVRPFLK